MRRQNPHAGLKRMGGDPAGWHLMLLSGPQCDTCGVGGEFQTGFSRVTISLRPDPQHLNNSKRPAIRRMAPAGGLLFLRGAA